MLFLLLSTLRDLLRPRRNLLFENLALRQQLLVLQRSSPPPQFNAADRVFWVLLLRLWEHWRRPLRLVRPQTVIA